MQRRKLGQQGLEVGAVGLGAMGMSIAYGESDDAESIATLHRARELGVTLFDTAQVYGPDLNEQLVGRAVAGFRDEIVIADKFGFDLGPNAQPGVDVDSRPETIRSSVEHSLELLGTDHIDVLYQHRPDPDVPIEEVAGTVGELIEAGKVRFFGLSEAGPETIRRAHAVQPVSVLQTEYSIFEREVEADVLPVVRELGIGFVPYSPLGRGFLTGTAKRGEEYSEVDFRRIDPRYQGENFDSNIAAANELQALAEERDITVAQLALAWLLHQGDDIVPIPGTRKVSRLEENVGALDVSLSQDDLERVDAILPGGSAGGRYPAAMMPTDW